MVLRRDAHAATLLGSGEVLVAGGSFNNDDDSTAEAELYDPLTGTFAVTGSMKTGRFWHAATLLGSGEVLMTGGSSGGSKTAVSGAELYDPSAGTFTATGSMTAARELHAATLLRTGEVLVSGGWSGSGAMLSSAELLGPIPDNSPTNAGCSCRTAKRQDGSPSALFWLGAACVVSVLRRRQRATAS